jgi:hypothetical protein
MEHDHMIEAFATNGANHPLDIGSLPRRARCRQDFANAHGSHVFSEVIAKDRIAVASGGSAGVGQREMPRAVAARSNVRSGGRSH